MRFVMVFRLFALIAAFLFFSWGALAQTVLGPEYDPEKELALCKTSINGESKWVIFEDTIESGLYDNYSFREIFFGPTDSITCPAFVSLNIMTPDLTRIQREAFCIHYDEEADTVVGFSEGERDAYLLCKEPGKPICERVNNSKDAAIALVGAFGGAAGGASAATSTAGVSAVTHSSGALILTGNAGYIAGTLGSLGTAAISILTAPATLAAASASVTCP